MAKNTTFYVPAAPIATIEGDYTRENEIYLKLSRSDLVSLSLVLKTALEGYGLSMCHETITANTGAHPDFSADSHIGRIVQLYRRVDAALHGRKTWNSAYRETAPHNSMKVSRP